MDVNVNQEIKTPDADSFKKSQDQIQAAAKEAEESRRDVKEWTDPGIPEQIDMSQEALCERTIRYLERLDRINQNKNRLLLQDYDRVKKKYELEQHKVQSLKLNLEAQKAVIYNEAIEDVIHHIHKPNRLSKPKTQTLRKKLTKALVEMKKKVPSFTCSVEMKWFDGKGLKDVVATNEEGDAGTVTLTMTTPPPAGTRVAEKTETRRAGSVSATVTEKYEKDGKDGTP